MRLRADQIALHDDQRDLGPAGTAQLVRAFARLLPSGGLVLDAGGGTGWAVPLLRAAGLVPVLVDLSPDMLAAGSGRGVPRIMADLTALPFGAGAFDAVHASYAIQNVPDWGAAVAECVRVLRPGGVAIVVWGGPSPDPVAGPVSAYYFSRLGSWGGTAAQQRGLTSTEQGTAAFERAGCEADAPVAVTAEQTRTLRQLVERLAGNPFRGRPPADIARVAKAATLAWTQQRYGDLDRDRRIQLAHTLHVYRRR